MEKGPGTGLTRDATEASAALNEVVRCHTRCRR
jgi:hypothetical protein